MLSENVAQGKSSIQVVPSDVLVQSYLVCEEHHLVSPDSLPPSPGRTVIRPVRAGVNVSVAGYRSPTDRRCLRP